MAGDRARDLTFSILSDTDKLDLGEAAQDMEDLGRAAQDSGRDLDNLDQAAKGLDLDRVGADAKATARKVDSAFDAIARSTKVGAAKVDDNADSMKRSMKDVGDEAGSTAREAAASFGSSGDIGDAMQELAANAPSVLGPLGLAFGAVAGIGVGLFRTKTEALKERVQELVDAMLEAGGQLSKEAVDAEVLNLAKSGDIERLREMVDLYDVAGVKYEDLVRAKAGDAEAMDRVNEALDVEEKRRKGTTDEMDKSAAAVAVLRAQIDETASVMADAKAVTDSYNSATQESGDQVVETVETTIGAWDDLRGSMVDPITGKVTVQAPPTARLREIRRQIAAGIGVIPVSLRVQGQSPYANNANNSRYRD